MKFSVLLPTHDRLELLRYALDTVRRQDDEDWEAIVADNASEQDVGGYVAGLGDPRVHYVRSESFLPVTENWNRALGHSSGDYVLMLGDDDALLPGCLSALRMLVEGFDSPDVIYTGAYLFAYPGVMPDAPGGYLQPYGYAPFLRRAREPFVIPIEQRLRLVRAAMNFRVRYGFNMQFAAISRGAIERLAPDGELFRSPFPDYYAMNLLFAGARDVVAEPRELVVIGVTSSSYGYFHAQGREAEAVALLGSGTTDGQAPALRDVLMPGTNINTGWLLAMEELSARLGPAAGLTPNRRRYRRLQIIWVHEQHYLRGTLGEHELAQLRARMGPFERLFYGGAARLARTIAALLPQRLRRAAGYAGQLALRQTPHFPAPREEGAYADVVEVFERFEREGPPTPHSP